MLSPDEAGELARVGLAIEKLYDEPMDIEWALAAGELSVVQARPITTPASRPATGPGEQWNDSLDGDYLWSNGNLGEAFPDVMTPATWSFVELLMSRMTFPPSLPGYRGYGRIGGRFYANVSMSISLEALAGISPRRFAALFGPVLGKLPPVEEIPRPRLPRWKATRLMVPATVALLRRVRASQKRMPQFLAGAPSRCERLRAEIEPTQTTKPDNTITGFPGAAGVVEGIARVLRTPEDAAQFGDGEILVTTVTNIGWTPIFPRAAAVVTDVGAPLSHAAIVARELGIPAVVGCGNATMLLHGGDRIRVDGGNGTIEVLHQA